MRKSTLVKIALIAFPAVAFAGATASNFQKETKKGTNYYNAQAMLDGKLDTAWLLPGESANLGEWVKLDLPKGEVDKIAIYPGWGKDEETFTDHPRVKKMKVEIICCADDAEAAAPVATHEILVEDKAAIQIIDIPDTKVGNEMFGGWIKLSVVDLYPGDDFPNLGISELYVVMKEFDARAKFVDEGASAPNVANMTDGNVKTFWTAPPAGAFFTFTADGYGVAGLTIEHGPKDYAKVKKVKVTANGRETEVEVADKPGPQTIPLPPIVGYTGSAWGEIRVDILEVTPGAKGDLAITEVKVKATNFEGI